MANLSIPLNSSYHYHYTFYLLQKYTTIFTQSIQTPELLTAHVLNCEYLPDDMSKILLYLWQTL